MNNDINIWEILVPANWNDGRKIHIPYHLFWDSKVRGIAGELTILKSAQGQ